MQTMGELSTVSLTIRTKLKFISSSSIAYELRASPELRDALSLVFEEEKPISNLRREGVSMRLHSNAPNNLEEQLR